MTSRRRVSHKLGLTFAVVALALYASLTVAVATEPTKVQFAGYGPADIGMSFLFTAVEKGYFKEEGIDFQYMPGQGGGDAIKRLITGGASFAWASTDTIMFAADQGGKVKGIFNIHNSFYDLAYLPEKLGAQVTKMQDWKGKKIGIISQASITRYLVMEALSAANMQQDDVSYIAVGFAPIPPLQAGQIDAYVSWPSMNGAMRKAGLNIANYSTGLDFPTDQIVTSEEILTKNHDLAERFVRAIVNAIKYEPAHFDEVANFLPKYMAAPYTPEAIRPVLENGESWIHGPQTVAHGLGYTDIDSLAPILSLLRKADAIQHDLDLHSLYTNEFQQKYGR